MLELLKRHMSYLNAYHSHTSTSTLGRTENNTAKGKEEKVVTCEELT